MYQNYCTPDGLNDLYGMELLYKNTIEEKLTTFMVANGYKPIQTPNLEFVDVYMNERTEMPPQDMYKVLDRQGNVLALRPDFTPAIARAISHSMKGEKVKVFSKGTTYRYQALYSGKANESTVFDVESIGESNAEQDALMICLAIESVLETGLRDFVLDVSDINFFMGLIEGLHGTEEWQESLQKAMDAKNKTEIASLLKDQRVEPWLMDLFCQLPDIHGNMSVIEPLLQMPLNNRAKQGLKRIKKVYTYVEDMGYGQYITVDISMIKRLNYYTGIVFRAVALGAGQPVLQGGRYDDLLKQFDNPLPAVGFGIDLMLTLQALSFSQSMEDQVVKVDYILGYNEDNFTLCNELRKCLIAQGKTVECIIYNTQEGLVDDNVVTSNQAMKALLKEFS